MRYKMRTSLGQVILFIDPNGFEKVTGETRDEFGKPNGEVSQIQNTKFIIESGSEHIDNLYDGWMSRIIEVNGDLFAIIDLSDEFYGAPQFYLERVE